MEFDCDVLVVGAGCGGVAAALAAAGQGLDVVLTEPTGWLGGQLTAQAVPPDEHPWVEHMGVTASYRRMRSLVRARYRADPRLRDGPRRDTALNPGSGWVSKLCAEPTVIHIVLAEMLASLDLTLLFHHRPISVDVQGDRIQAVRFDLDVVVRAKQVIDATEEGDLLPLAGCEHVLGAESSADTGEPHAVDGPARPFDQQAITWCAALEYDPRGEHVIERPKSYEFWRGYQAPFWPGPQLGWTTEEPETGRPLRRPLFGADDEQDLWRFRRIRHGAHYDPPLPDVTLVNWPHIDYWLEPITGVAEDLRRERLDQARELTLSFVYWMQTEAGYPGLRLSEKTLGTDDGLAAAPYIREARRIKAEFTVLEQHIGVEVRPGAAEAEQFADSVGIGSYRIDLHPSTGGQGYVDIPSYPFQIPLGALIPVRVDNLIAGGKCLGVTHITNGCYRLHPVEWNVGEAAGLLAAHAVARGVPPRAIRARTDLLGEFQDHLQALGIELEWPAQIRTQRR
ncbi:FAD-dependent oxidoreductase [Allokutzneria sp. A3M-2-11 16]|uniref:FAD-dependent oxidoreductase n=1 Tax=Allokutzneria sp. A3M-2-11 16 TaxID=2962043 RepID=UPI0020B82B40|nr:FAD-dependent oxidoreductase [Allokutzneria sp. A3M-2-11 16]MCP3798396.1 FAD-dependent oxidoreductase [Allokutzneria sp. A3M-2-11 16]